MPRKSRIIEPSVTVVTHTYGKRPKKDSAKLLQDQPTTSTDAHTTAAAAQSMHCSALECDTDDEAATSNKRSYEYRKKKTQESWNKIQDRTFNLLTSAEVQWTNCCTKCSKSDNGIIRCNDCGKFAIYCRACEAEVHRNVLHKPEIWNVSYSMRL